MTGHFVVSTELREFLIRSSLLSPTQAITWTPLTGGVSSDIWKVETPGRVLCIKRALAKLRVAADWEVPVSRNAYEWEWLKFAATHVPQAVPAPLAHDPDVGLFAMEFLAAEQHPVWKQQLLDGHIEPSVARELGSLVGRLHHTSRRSAALAQRFATDENFDALRLDAYLRATAVRHPQLASRLLALAERTGSIHTALVHGDVSPKNILVGPNGPVILDAECAWYGDPAFDVAFLLNHLLLKCLVNPHLTEGYLDSYRQFSLAYFEATAPEDRADIEARASTLLPALLLARVDGKSPVEYLCTEAPKALIRAFSTRLILNPSFELNDIAKQWQGVIASA
ncbi:phosphotransferase family protein [Pseudomonas sp. GM21]|uniref:phosphotransferase family protein n=1 Tax=Pseudomonas sp. GM21 TaxID=1144325 RepID=UPI000272590D|nr:phosphotransferase [Pseudomonas sp. GM21]EJM22917.1 phosphotransferase family protein [Pseudomonas sp. GM21]